MTSAQTIVVVSLALIASVLLAEHAAPAHEPIELDGMLATHALANSRADRYVTRYQVRAYALSAARAAMGMAAELAGHTAQSERVTECLANHIATKQPSNPDPRSLSVAILDAAATNDLDPAILTGVAGSESSYGAPHYMIGDDGKACGAFQQHPRWLLPIEDRTRANIQLLCDRLIADVHFAAHTAAPQLKARPICHYNQGMRCLEGEGYTGRVMRRAERARAACPDLASYRASHSAIRALSEIASR